MREAAGPYFRALRHHWRFVIAITVIAAGIAIVSLIGAGRSYQGNASILLSPLPTGDPSWVGTGVVITSGDPDRDMQTGVALIDSDQSAAAAARVMGSGWTAQRVEGAVSVTPLGQSDVISVAAKGSSPQQAARLANVFAAQAVASRSATVQKNIARKLTSLRAQVTSLTGKTGGATELTSVYSQLNELQSTHGDPTFSVSQAAQPPTTPIGTSRDLIVLLSLVGGFMIASVAALGLEFLSRPVRDENELEEIFPSPVLATIPPIRRPGSAPVDPWRLTAEAFEQIRMVRVQVELEKGSAPVMVTSAGPGDGKTSVVSGLAASFSESGRRTVVIDLDLRKPSLARTLKVDVPRIRPGRGDSDWLERALIQVPGLPNVMLLPLAQVTGWNVEETMSRLPAILRRLEASTDAIVIDTAPVGEVSETLKIAQLCRSVVFVARLRHTDRRQLARARELLLRVGARPEGMVIVGGQIVQSYGGYAYSSANSLEPIARPSAVKASTR